MSRHQVANPNINIGRTHSKKRVGKPDHLIVADDVYSIVSYDPNLAATGNPKYSTITYRAVDSAGHGVGRVWVTELI